jgi:hypothetical protein
MTRYEPDNLVPGAPQIPAPNREITIKIILYTILKIISTLPFLNHLEEYYRAGIIIKKPDLTKCLPGCPIPQNQ